MEFQRFHTSIKTSEDSREMWKVNLHSWTAMRAGESLFHFSFSHVFISKAKLFTHNQLHAP